MDYGLAKVADLIIKHVITPVVKRGSAISFVEEVNQDSKEMTEAILKIVPSIDPKVIIFIKKFRKGFLKTTFFFWFHSAKMFNNGFRLELLSFLQMS